MLGDPVRTVAGELAGLDTVASVDLDDLPDDVLNDHATPAILGLTHATSLPS
jgi:hypothetical protein